MSAVTSRLSVSGIAITANTNVTVPGARIAQPLLSAVSGFTGQLGTAADHMVTAVELPSVAVIREKQAARKRATLKGIAVGSVEALRIDAAERLADYSLPPAHGLEAAVSALANASTPMAARAASTDLLRAAAAQHHAAFTDQIVAACSIASVAAGFETVTISTTNDGTIRVCATSEKGHALVTEILAHPDREPSIATEVVGLHDGTCQAILDSFDAALDAAGVRAARSRRSTTGGVAELTAARDFIRRKLTPSKATVAADKTGGDSPAGGPDARRTVRVRSKQRRS